VSAIRDQLADLDLWILGMRRMAMRSGVLGSWRGLGEFGRAVRHMETATGLTGAAVQHSETEVLKSLVGGMTKHARGFPIKGDSVEILETPSQFYNVLLQGVRNARSRVVIASLYIGTGTLEQELVGSSCSLPPFPCVYTLYCKRLWCSALSMSKFKSHVVFYWIATNDFEDAWQNVRNKFVPNIKALY